MRNRLGSVLVMILIVFFSRHGVAVVYEEGQSGTGSQMPQAKYREGELLVKFRTGVSDHSKAALHRKHGSERIKEFPALRLHHVNVKQGMTIEAALALYRSDSDVEFAEPNFIVAAQAAPNDPWFGELWGLQNTGQTGGVSDADIDAPEAWNMTTGSGNVVVAVIDSGVDYAHQDLAANQWVNPGETPGNGIDDDGNGYVDDVYGIDVMNNDANPQDDLGHGTHVAGTIGAAGNNAVGVAGVNWTVKILPCKFLDVEGYGYDSGAIECLEYVRALKSSGANIVATNNSWGGGGPSQALAEAIDAQREILFIAAAGNDGCDTDEVPSYPAGYYLPNVISVAATDHSDARSLWTTQPGGCAPGSNYGRRTTSISAPGSDILSTIPNQGYGIASGTSMATPHVTGLAALLKSQDMNRDWKSIKNLVLSGGDDIASMGDLSVTGMRMNAYGSLACSSRPFFSVLRYPSALAAGVPTTFSAISIDCAAPVGPVTVSVSGGETIILQDDGTAPDSAAGDGIFSGAWTPSSSDSQVAVFTSPAGQEQMAVPPVENPASPVMIAGTPPMYVSSIQNALSTAVDGDLVLVQAGEFAENLVMSRPVSVALSGGYDGRFNGISGDTIIHGSLTVGGGTVIIGPGGAFVVY